MARWLGLCAVPDRLHGRSAVGAVCWGVQPNHWCIHWRDGGWTVKGGRDGEDGSGWGLARGFVRGNRTVSRSTAPSGHYWRMRSDTKMCQTLRLRQRSRRSAPRARSPHVSRRRRRYHRLRCRKPRTALHHRREHPLPFQPSGRKWRRPFQSRAEVAAAQFISASSQRGFRLAGSEAVRETDFHQCLWVALRSLAGLTKTII